MLLVNIPVRFAASLTGSVRLRLISSSCCVSELPPQILTEDGSTYTFIEGQKAVLECETFGSPKPKVTW